MAFTGQVETSSVTTPSGGCGSGELVDDRGHRTNYVLFLVDYLEAVRLIKTLLTIVEKITLDQLDIDPKPEE